MYIDNSNSPSIIDKHFRLKCPHCGDATGLTAISIPYYPLVARYKPNKVGIAYKCHSCDEPVFLKFQVIKYEPTALRVEVGETYHTIENPLETFEYEFLPENVKNDFSEALQCYSIKAYNAFAAMCRRTIQSAAAGLGTKGSDKVQKQIVELKEMADVDDDTYDILKQIILDGHDGAHPHLPVLSPSRADILLELMKDVMYQLYVRKGKLAKAAEMRKEQIENSRNK